MFSTSFSSFLNHDRIKKLILFVFVYYFWNAAKMFVSIGVKISGYV